MAQCLKVLFIEEPDVSWTAYRLDMVDLGRSFVGAIGEARAAPWLAQ